MASEERACVVVPALDEEAGIAAVVAGFRARPEVERVLVVDNGSRDRTAERARAAGAEVRAEARPGYGSALRAGLEHALHTGARRLVLVEADDTFDPADVGRLLEPLASHDLVLGSRHGSGALPRHQELGNLIVARLVSGLWPRGAIALTDVGCTYRALTAAAWERLRARVTASGPEFSPQMICAAFAQPLAVREVRVAHRARAGGSSKHTGDLGALTRTALRMLRTIGAERMRGPG